MKKALTYTIIAGSKTCTNDCGICISKMTPSYGIDNKEPKVDWAKFEKATRIAMNHGAKNVLITGKGEPTLYPGQITRYLTRLYGKSFDTIELQTNGSMIANGGLYDAFLESWKDLGLDTVAVSIYHYDSQKNKEMFKPKNGNYFDLPKLIKKIHSKDLNTRLSCVMLDGCIDNIEEVKKLIKYAKDHEVFQLTLRSVDCPRDSLSSETTKFVNEHKLNDKKIKTITDFLKKDGAKCDVLPHGAIVYEINEQNVCLTTGLTFDPGQEEIRQLVFFPQGWLTTSWENVYGGRIL
ncbi:MAG: radical SAM protein [Candidatus Aenigmatarchaeota archaeon]